MTSLDKKYPDLASTRFRMHSRLVLSPFLCVFGAERRLGLGWGARGLINKTNNDLPDSESTWVFEEMGKPEYLEKNLSAQMREPTTINNS